MDILTVPYQQNITNEDLVSFVNGFPNCKKLCLGYTNIITPEAIPRLSNITS
jgi:hypothetical protein